MTGSPASSPGARTRAREDPLFRIVEPARLTAVVDVGSNPIDGDPPYKGMLARGLCTVVGFEPQRDAFELLRSRKSELETYLADAIGDGGRHTLHVCRSSGMTSLFKPDARMLGLFHLFPELGEVTSTEPVQTRTLDSIDGIAALDFLKMDVQGSELAALQGGRARLAEAVAVQAEVSFIPLYERQPVFHEVDRELRAQGFIPHAFAAIKRWGIAPLKVNNDPRRALNQLLEADAVYVRDFSRPDLLGDEQLKHLAMIAHHCYGSQDLAMRCLYLLRKRGALGADVQQRYLDVINAPP